MNVLVAGGAGYIGSHMCKRLAEAGHAVVVLDDLSTGHREAVQWGELVESSLGDTALVAETLRRHHIDAVMHFAASRSEERRVGQACVRSVRSAWSSSH